MPSAASDREQNHWRWPVSGDANRSTWATPNQLDRLGMHSGEVLFELVKAALLNTPGMWMAWSDLRCFWMLYSLRTQQANQKRGSWILIRQDKSICFQQNSWEKSCKMNWDGIWYLYRRYIFLRTSTPKIKLQKGAQYETFNTKNKPWIGGDSCV